MSDNNEKIEIQVDFLEKLRLKIKERMPRSVNKRSETKYYNTAAGIINRDVKESKTRIRNGLNYEEIIGYFSESDLNIEEGLVISGESLGKWFKKLDSGSLTGVSDQAIPTFNDLAIFMNYFGWQGYLERPKFTISAAILKYRKSKVEGLDDSPEINRKIREFPEITNILKNLQDAAEERNELKESIEEVRRMIFIILRQVSSEVRTTRKERIVVPTGEVHEFSKWYDAIIDANKLNHTQIQDIRGFLFSDKEWHERALICSALSISILNCWDVEKVKLLISFVGNTNEPIVYKRAVIGLAISLIVAYPNGEYYSSTIEEILYFKGGGQDRLEFNAGLFECISFFISKGEYFIGRRTKILYDQIGANSISLSNRKCVFQYFEPLHNNLSYHRKKSIDFETNEQDTKFFKLLNDSSALDFVQKVNFFSTLDIINAEEKRELINVFEWEDRVLHEFKNDFLGEVVNIYFEYELKYFSRQLNEASMLNERRMRFNNILDNIDVSIIANSLLNKFPYYRYVRFVHLNRVCSDNSLNNNLAVAKYLHEVNDIKRTIIVLKKMLSHEILDMRILAEIGILLSQVKQNRLALETLKKAVDNGLTDPIALSRSGVFFYKNNEKEYAILSLIRAYSENLEFAFFLGLGGWVLYNLGDNNSIKFLKKSIDNDLNDAEILARGGSILWENGEIEYALMSFKKSVDNNLKEVYFLILSGALHYFENQIDYSIKSLKRAFSIGIKKHRLFMFSVELLSKMGEGKFLIESIKKAVDENDKGVRDLFILGDFFYEIGEKQYSAECLKNYLKYIPTDCESLVRAGDLLRKLNEKKLAYSSFNMAIACSLDVNYSVHEEKVNNTIDRHEYLVRSFKRAIELGAANLEELKGIGGIFMSEGKIKKGAELLIPLAESRPEFFEEANTLECLYLMANRVDDARELCESSISANGGDAVIFMFLGHCLLVQDNEDAALINYKKCIDFLGHSREFFEEFEEWEPIIVGQRRITKAKYREIAMKLEQYGND